MRCSLISSRIFEGGDVFEGSADREQPLGSQDRQPIFEALRNFQEEDVLFLEEIHPVEIDVCLSLLEQADELPAAAAEFFGFKTEIEREESKAIRSRQAVELAKAWREFLKRC